MSADWNTLRRSIVGGSDVPAVFDVPGEDGDGFISCRELHEQKAGRMPPRDDNDALWFGQEMEAVGVKAARRKGLDAYRWQDVNPDALAAVLPPGVRMLDTDRGPMLTRPDGLGGNPDGVVIEPDGALSGLEFKNVSAWAWRNLWNGGGTIPPGYELQSRTYLGVLAWRRWHIVPIVEGRRAEVMTLDSDPVLFAGIEAGVAEFWRVHALGPEHWPAWQKTPKDRAAVARMFKAMRGTQTARLEGAELRELAAALHAARAERLAAEKHEADLEAEWMARGLEAAEYELDDGWRVTFPTTRGNPGKRAGDLPPDQIIGARRDSRSVKVHAPGDGTKKEKKR